MENTFHYLLMMAQSNFHKQILNKISKIGLSPGQPKVLEYLKDNDGCEQKSIGNACSLESATVTGILQRMEENGLIEKRQLNGNHRSYYVFLTEKGRKAAGEVEKIFLSIEERALQNINKEKQDEMKELLALIYENLRC